MSLLLALACSDPKPPNVLVVTFDTTRADHVDLVGQGTPSWKGLATTGRVFTDAYTPAPVTLPAHVSLWTGLDPDEHGVRANGLYQAPGELEFLSERLRAAGWSTGAVVGALPLHSQFGTDQGFDHFDDEGLSVTERPFDPERDATAVTDAALAMLPELDPPYLLWVHYFDPHLPWAESYSAEIREADEELGRLLEHIDDNTLIVATADHGEGLGDHGERTHGYLLHRATLHVPLVLSGPGVTHGVERRRVSLTDVPAMVMHHLDGSTWEPEDRPLYAESEMPMAVGAAPIQSLFVGDARIVRTTRDRLFIGAEETPSEDPELLAELGALLDERPMGTAKRATLEEQTRVELEALGYLMSRDDRGLDIYEHLDRIESPQRIPPEVLADPALLATFLARNPDPHSWAEALSRTSSSQVAPHLDAASALFPDDLLIQALVAWHGPSDEALERVLADQGPLRRRSPAVLVIASEAALKLDRDDDARRLCEELDGQVFFEPDLLQRQARLRQQLESHP